MRVHYGTRTARQFRRDSVFLCGGVHANAGRLLLRSIGKYVRHTHAHHSRCWCPRPRPLACCSRHCEPPIHSRAACAHAPHHVDATDNLHTPPIARSLRMAHKPRERACVLACRRRPRLRCLCVCLCAGQSYIFKITACGPERSSNMLLMLESFPCVAHVHAEIVINQYCASRAASILQQSQRRRRAPKARL